MIKIFRKARQKLLSDNKFTKYLIYAIGEIVLVVIGILIALSINNWNQEKSDRKIEKDYTLSLIEDVKTDLSNFNAAIEANEDRIKNLDLYADLCFNYSVEENKAAELFIQHLKSLGHPDFVIPTDRTISQLKNTGGMRLITDKTKLNAIVDYEGYFEKLKNQQTWYEGGLKEVAEGGIHIFNNKFMPKKDEKFDEKLFFKTVQLNSTDKKLIIEQGNRVRFYYEVTDMYLFLLKEGKQKSLELIKLLESDTTTD